MSSETGRWVLGWGGQAMTCLPCTAEFLAERLAPVKTGEKTEMLAMPKDIVFEVYTLIGACD